jgi:hypothetical protein
MKLQDRLPDGVEVRGKWVKLDFDFRNVLHMLDVLGNRDLIPAARDYLALKCLTRHPRHIPETMAAVRAVLFIQGGDAEQKKLTDFEQDAPMIRTAFRQVYNIDLFRAKLHWLEFIELLNNLPDGSRYMDVLGIRARPIPAPTKYNQKEREWLMKAKAAHALHMSDEEQERYYEKAVQNVFSGLLKLAKEGGNTPNE